MQIKIRKAKSTSAVHSAGFRFKQRPISIQSAPVTGNVEQTNTEYDVALRDFIIVDKNKAPCGGGREGRDALLR